MVMSTGGDQLDPDRLESADFPLVRRGFDPDLVTTQMLVVAQEIRELRGLVAELESQGELFGGVTASALSAEDESLLLDAWASYLDTAIALDRVAGFNDGLVDTMTHH